MARKLNIPKAAQIRGIRKALANPKTPKQFRAGLKKRLAKLLACILFVFIASRVRAQTPVIIQPLQQTLASSVACTGSAQDFPVNNRNQTQHYATITIATSTSLQATIFGLDNSGNKIQISDTGYFSYGTAAPVVLVGSGYYPTVEVEIVCLPASTGSFSINYSGSSAISPLSVGGQMATSLYKPMLTGASAGTNFSTLLATPYGNSAGTISLQYSSGTGPGSSTLSVSCTDLSNVANPPIGIAQSSFTLLTATTQQNFPILPAPCTALLVRYTAGGASSSLVTIVYSFSAPTTANVTLAAYSHITGTTATAVRSNGGTLIDLNLNTAAAGTISIFDLATASCTGTPSTNVVAVLTINATDSAHDIEFNKAFDFGICVKASVAMDLTVGYQ